jgi:hypothetical protein
MDTSVFFMKKFNYSNSLYMISEVSMFIYTQLCSFSLINFFNISLIHPLRKKHKIRGVKKRHNSSSLAPRKTSENQYYCKASA